MPNLHANSLYKFNKETKHFIDTSLESLENQRQLTIW